MRKSLLFKLIIVNAIILGFVLNFLALTLAIWFRGNFFNEKRTQFKKIGEYISRTIDVSNAEHTEVRKELQDVIDMASISINAEIHVINKSGEVYLSSDDNTYSKLNISEENITILKEELQTSILGTLLLMQVTFHGMLVKRHIILQEMHSN